MALKLPALVQFAFATVFFIIYMSLYARLRAIGAATDTPAGWGLTGAVLGLIVSVVGCVLMAMSDIHKMIPVKIALGALVGIVIWFVGGGVGFLALSIDTGFADSMVKACLAMGVIASAIFYGAYIVSNRVKEIKTPKIPALVAFVVAAVFALIALGLAAKTRSDGGSGANIPEAFAITGDVLVFVFSLIGGICCVAGVWQEGFVGIILRDTVWGFCFIGLWLIGAYCGLASTLVTINLVIDRFKAEFAFHVLTALATIVAVVVSSALGHEESS
jgi:hypothetical protein